jgi:hypothetical protein
VAKKLKYGDNQINKLVRAIYGEFDRKSVEVITAKVFTTSDKLFTTERHTIRALQFNHLGVCRAFIMLSYSCPEAPCTYP